MFSPVSWANVRITSLMSASFRFREIGSPVYTFSPAVNVRPLSEPLSAGVEPPGVVACPMVCVSLNTSSLAAVAGTTGDDVVARLAALVPVPPRRFRVAGAGAVCMVCALITERA